MADGPAHDFAVALAARDFPRLRSMFAADVDFRALTPRRAWEANDPDAVIAILGTWFDPGVDITALLAVHTGQVVDTHQVGYRFGVTTGAGPHEIEQQAYLRTEGRAEGEVITWMRVLCSGFRPQSIV